MYTENHKNPLLKINIEFMYSLITLNIGFFFFFKVAKCIKIMILIEELYRHALEPPYKFTTIGLLYDCRRENAAKKYTFEVNEIGIFFFY